MPIPLLARCQPDSIREFRAAAEQRARDAAVLSAAERRTGAIYLWGYAAEMTLKAAYFEVIGFADTQNIAISDLVQARTDARVLGVFWPGNLHDVRAWGELLVSTRASTVGLNYTRPAFGNRVVLQSRIIDSLWREILRYHKNVAYVHELGKVQSAARWLLSHSRML